MTNLTRHIDTFRTEACHALASALGVLGSGRPDPACCERALRAYFGHRWPGSSDRLSAVEIVEGSNFLHRLAGEINAFAGRRVESPAEDVARDFAAPAPRSGLPHHGDDTQWWDYARALHGEDARPRQRRPHPPARSDDEAPDGGPAGGQPQR